MKTEIQSLQVSITELRPSRIKEASRLLAGTVKESKNYYTAKETRESLKNAAKLSTYYRKDVTFLRVAEVNGKLVGIVLCYLPPKPKVKFCWISWIGVSKKFRRRGIGSLLLKSLETESWGRWQKIQCNVRMTNICSNRLFMRAGYKKVRSLKRKIRKRNAYRWEKWLIHYPNPQARARYALH